MKILIGHISLNKGKPNTIYLGRGKSNKLYPLLANDYSHRDGTLATYKVASVEEACSCYRSSLKYNLLANTDGYRNQMRALYTKTVELYEEYGEVIYLCWCKNESNPRPHDHECHCEYLRNLNLVKYSKEYPNAKTSSNI